MSAVDFKLNSDNTHSDVYSVKINGVEISNCVSEINLHVKACEQAVLTVKANIDCISVDTRAIWDIPEPYKSYMESEIKKVSTKTLSNKATNKKVDTETKMEVSKYIKAKGIAISTISEKMKIPIGRLYKSLSEKGTRDLRASEFLMICSFLEKDPTDFMNKETE